MADTTTELEVLDQIVDVLGGQSGQYETVVPVLQQIKELLASGGAVADGAVTTSKLADNAVTMGKLSQEVQEAIAEGGSGYNPSLSVGRADALTGADSTAQWAQRTTEGSGAATVRSVQGATEVQDGELVPVRIAGIASTDAQGGELDAIELTAQTLRAAGTIRDELTATELVTRVGVVDLGTLTWAYGPTDTADKYRMVASNLAADILKPSSVSVPAALSIVGYTNNGNDKTYTCVDKSIGVLSNGALVIYDEQYNQQSSPAAFKTAMNGVILFYGLITPTTTPISPALPMTYKVQQGGSESIIVPDGEVSAAPIITAAEGKSAAAVVMDALACIAAPDGPVATVNHALNTYLTMGGKLYKVTSTIAVGETITAGTNVTETTVMAELIARTA